MATSASNKSEFLNDQKNIRTLAEALENANALGIKKDGQITEELRLSALRALDKITAISENKSSSDEAVAELAQEYLNKVDADKIRERLVDAENAYTKMLHSVPVEELDVNSEDLAGRVYESPEILWKELNLLQTAIGNLSKELGDELTVMVLKTGFFKGTDVTPIYSYDKALVREGWDILEKAQNADEPVEGLILGSNKGGAMIDIKGVQGFIPSSQLLSYFVPDENVTDSSVEVDVTGRKNLEKNINNKISLKVLEVDQTRNRAILSERALMQELKEKAKQKVMLDLVEGQIIQAKIIGEKI